MRTMAVNLAERKTTRDGDVSLVAMGLGSCLAVVMYDSLSQVAGMNHAVLPHAPVSTLDHSPKYVDSGIRGLYEEMTRLGARTSTLKVWLVGGADLFLTSEKLASFNIGSRNIAAARESIEVLGLVVKGQDVGGHVGRTIRLLVGSGRVFVHLVGEKEREL